MLVCKPQHKLCLLSFGDEGNDGHLAIYQSRQDTVKAGTRETAEILKSFGALAKDLLSGASMHKVAHSHP